MNSIKPIYLHQTLRLILKERLVKNTGLSQKILTLKQGRRHTCVLISLLALVQTDFRFWREIGHGLLTHYLSGFAKKAFRMVILTPLIKVYQNRILV